MKQTIYVTAEYYKELQFKRQTVEIVEYAISTLNYLLPFNQLITFDEFRLIIPQYLDIENPKTADVLKALSFCEGVIEQDRLYGTRAKFNYVGVRKNEDIKS